MKKALVILCGVFGLTLALPSQAEWTLLTESDQSRYYIDLDTIEQSDGYVYAWQLVDNFNPQTAFDATYYSVKIFNQISCDIPKKRRRLQQSLYGASMGNGSRIHTIEEPWDWAYPEPRTVLKVFLDRTCLLSMK